MRKNLPINNVETVIQDDQYLISKTDTKGRITYANPAFIQVSGFTREELIGKAHNVVRHPDMPAEVFKNLWDTLQAGQAWEGIVRNRRKDGGFYWVKAHASPIVEEGTVTGYASVRTKASEAEIALATRFYQDLNEAQSLAYRVDQGRIVAAGWRRPWQALQQFWGPQINAAFWRKVSFSAITSTLFICALFLPTSLGMAIRMPLLLAAAGTLLLLGLLMDYVLMRKVDKAFKTATHVAQQIAAGNLVLDTRSDALRHLGDLGTNLDLMRKSLLSISQDVDHSVESNLAMAQTLRQSSARLEARTMEQAASLQQTSSSLASFSTAVSQTAQNAHISHELSERSSDYVQKGNQTVSALNLAMQTILSSSEKIRSIVSMIEHIAFQTNILSINASIESARAGSAGRGFAVVAAEVRTLARQASEAADEIKRLIDETCTHTRTGAVNAQQVEAAMADIFKSSNEVTLLMAEISTATGEQSTGLEQLSQALQQVDKITTDNALLVKDLHLSAEAMNSNEIQLQDSIAVLNYGQQDRQDHLHTAHNTAELITLPLTARSLEPTQRTPGKLRLYREA